MHRYFWAAFSRRWYAAPDKNDKSHEGSREIRNARPIACFLGLACIKLQIPLSPISQEYSRPRFRPCPSASNLGRVKSPAANRDHVRNYHTTHIFIRTAALSDAFLPRTLMEGGSRKSRHSFRMPKVRKILAKINLSAIAATFITCIRVRTLSLYWPARRIPRASSRYSLFMRRQIHKSMRQTTMLLSRSSRVSSLISPAFRLPLLA